MRIVGIILLTILCILLFLILAVLFLPVRYRVQGECHEKLSATVRVRALCGLLRFVGEYQNKQFNSNLWILFWKHKGKDEKKTKSKTSVEPDIGSSVPISDEITATKSEEETVEVKNTSEHEIEEDLKQKEESKENNEEKPDKEPKKSKKQKGFKSIIENCKRKYRNIKHNIKKYKRILEDERNHKAVAHLKKETVRLLQVIMPKQLKLEATFSAGAPDTTGKALGILALFPIGYRNRWKIYPDFEADKAYIDGETEIKGRIYLFQLVGIGLRLLLDKDCRRLYRWLSK